MKMPKSSKSNCDQICFIILEYEVFKGRKNAREGSWKKATILHGHEFGTGKLVAEL
jgi:hypothetical protein